MLGIYVHFPFCASKCSYCDFYSFPGNESQIDEYIEALCRRVSEFPEEPADTVYFGGGTPSLLGGERLRQVLDAIRAHFPLADGAEITVECNPDSMDDALLKTLRAAGVNRLSIGVQSALEEELRLLGRRHSFPQAKDAVRRARAHGFDNLSLDLMYGLPGQDTGKFLMSLEAVLALGPEHVSCYGLKLEEGTPLHHAAPELPDDDAQAETYLALCERLKNAGFVHYEISNFAKPGFFARHNAKYWDLSPYLGLGAAAHSFYRGQRFAFARNIELFVRGAPPVPEETVEGFDTRAEYLMLRLRTAEGVSRTEFERRFGGFAEVERVLRLLEAHGLTVCGPDGCRLTEQGFLVSNTIINMLL